MSTCVETCILLGVGVILTIEWAVRTSLVAFYRWFPFPTLLDALYQRLAILRRYFNEGFRGPQSAPECNYDFRQLVESAGYRVEDHYVETADGFCLVLHRIATVTTTSSCDPPQTPQMLEGSQRRPSQRRHRRHLVRAVEHVPSATQSVQRLFPSEKDQSIDLPSTRSMGDIYVLGRPKTAQSRPKLSPTLEYAVLSSVDWVYRGSAQAITTEDPPLVEGTARWNSQERRRSSIDDENTTDSFGPMRSNCSWERPDSTKKHPVLLWHGLMMCSEVFVVDKRVSLAMTLADAGYDVWLGNNRGNKYSWLHRVFKRHDDSYWDFSIDELARFDIPASVGYILRVTGVPTLSYIGFSNGSAQMFASLSTNEALNRVIDLFVALAPACRVQTLHPEAQKFGLLYPLLSSSRRLFITLFGRRAMLCIAMKWKSILSAKYFTTIIDWTIWGLFAWHPRNVDPQRLLCTPLFYDINKSRPSLVSDATFYNDAAGDSPEAVSVPEYRLHRITVPVILMHGTKDRLSDVGWIISQLRSCRSFGLLDYEHLDCLCARDVPQKLFPLILRVLAERMQPATVAHGEPSSSPCCMPADPYSDRAIETDNLGLFLVSNTDDDSKMDRDDTENHKTTTDNRTTSSSVEDADVQVNGDTAYGI